MMLLDTLRKEYDNVCKGITKQEAALFPTQKSLATSDEQLDARLMQHFRKAPQKVVEKADPQIWAKKQQLKMSQIEEQEDILRRKLIDRQNALEKNLRAVEKQNMAAMQ